MLLRKYLPKSSACKEVREINTERLNKRAKQYVTDNNFALVYFSATILLD
jgi:hypothetical protein